MDSSPFVKGVCPDIEQREIVCDGGLENVRQMFRTIPRQG